MAGSIRVKSVFGGMIDDFKLYFFFFNFQSDNLAARS